ncbi:SET domain-containing protein-lysine N-methyltransferase [Chloroflexota bacterium]
MDNFWPTVWITVVGTLITTLIIYLIIYLFRDLILVHIGQYLITKAFKFFPSSRNISGIWETEFWKNGESFTEVAKVTQAFGKVWGVIQYQKGPQQRKYRMRGSIKEGIVVATYETISPKEAFDRGSFTLRVLSDGFHLKGYYSWTDDDSPYPKGNEYVWSNPAQVGLNGIRVRKSPIQGRGVFANKTYSQNSEVAYFHGYEVETDTRHSLTLTGRIIEPTGPLKLLNHSCDPNCHFADRTLYTLRDINTGTELTINYLSTEVHLSHSFKCKCRWDKCVRKVCTVK